MLHDKGACQFCIEHKRRNIQSKRSILGRQQQSDTLAGVNEGVCLGLGLNQVGSRPSINIHQNRMRTSTIFGARTAQRRCPISSNLGQKYLVSDRWMERSGVGFTCLGWTSGFYPGGVPAIRNVSQPSCSSFIEFTPTFVRKFGQSRSQRKYAQGPNVLYLEFPACMWNDAQEGHHSIVVPRKVTDYTSSLYCACVHTLRYPAQIKFNESTYCTIEG